jgi:hypothetical protein
MNRQWITAAAAAAAGILVGFVAGAGVMAVRLGDDDEALIRTLPVPPRRRADGEGAERRA